MKRFSLSALRLQDKAVIVVGAIVLLAIGLNTGLNMYTVSGKFREALIGRATVLADGVKRDVDKAVGFGLPLEAMEGMSERLRALVEVDADLSHAMIMDGQGKILYASDRTLEGVVVNDEPARKAIAAASPIVQSYRDARGEHSEKVLPLLNAEGRPAGVFRIAVRGEAVRGQLRGVLLSSLGVGVISFTLATILVTLFIRRVITGPLSVLVASAERMAKGDLSQVAPPSGSGEIASLGQAINKLAANLRDMLGRMGLMIESVNDAIKLLHDATQKMSRGARVQREATEQTGSTVNEMLASIKGVADNAAEMSQAATEASSSVSEMASSIEEMAANAGVLSTAAEDTAASIVETLASIRQVSENTESLSASAEQTSSSITEMSATVKEVEQKALESARLAEKVAVEASERGMAAARESLTGMEHIRATVSATSDMINRLGSRSKEIGQILKVIDEVTDQTGLLALNAAILAAQAGEHGKGFAVVAEEIRDLAERTTASTKEIAQLISAVQEESAASVQAVAKGLEAVERGVDIVRVTSDLFDQVAESSKQAAETARAIELTTAEQARGVAQITEASVSVAGQIEQIAHALQEQRKGSERIAQASERIRDITRQMKASTQEQTAGSRQIARAMESVTGQATQVARSTSEQGIGAQQISDAMVSIQKITEENVDVSVEMDMAELALKDKAAELRAELQKFKL